MDNHDSGSNWGEYRRLVLSEINRTIQGVAKVETSVNEVKEEMRNLIKSVETRVDLIEKRMDIETAKAKVKASIYGGLAGLIIGMIPVIIKFASSL